MKRSIAYEAADELFLKSGDERYPRCKFRRSLGTSACSFCNFIVTRQLFVGARHQVQIGVKVGPLATT